MTTSLQVVATIVRPPAVDAATVRDKLFGALHRGHIDLADGWERTPDGDVMALAWLTVADPADAASTIATIPFAEHGWLLEARPQWDGATATPGRPVPGVKQVTFLRRAPGIDHAAFADHWSTRHAALARRHHPALWRYRQNIVLDVLLPGTPTDVDGVAELGMRLRQDFRDRMYDSEEGRRIVGDDVRQFLDLRSSWRLLTREYPI